MSLLPRLEPGWFDIVLKTGYKDKKKTRSAMLMFANKLKMHFLLLLLFYLSHLCIECHWEDYWYEELFYKRATCFSFDIYQC